MSSPSTLSRQRSEHCYFLDPMTAFQVASQRNRVETDNGQTLQYCYYHGEPIDGAPENLHSVTIDSLSSFFVANPALPIPSYLDLTRSGLDDDACAVMLKEFKTIVSDMQTLREKQVATADAMKEVIDTVHVDTYFLDRDVARETALQQNRVGVNHPTITGLQLCYYDGEPFDDGPNNLIHVPAEQFVDYFTDTLFRIPEAISLPAGIGKTEELQVRSTFVQLLSEVEGKRKAIANHFFKAGQGLKPEFVPGEPLRIYLPASRITTVMQYSSKGLANAFARLGHEAHFLVEQDDREHLDTPWYLKAHFDINPHVIVNINHVNNGWLAPDVFNVVWWQDPTNEIKDGNPIAWRERDLVLAAYSDFDPFIEKTGMHDITRQGFCMDSEVFKPRPEIERKPRMVFVGTSYRNHLTDDPAEKYAVKELEKAMAEGQPLTRELCQELADETGLEMLHLWHYRLNYVVRDNAVRWMCQQDDIEPVVYGRGWEDDPIVAPYYKGELEHGEAVAQVYNEADYALVPLPQDINSQRLAEVAACGATPVVYDCRHHADLPHWDDECLFFRTQQQLYECIGQKPKADPAAIAEENSYDHMAKKLLQMMEERLQASANADVG